jgi:DNA-binding transcriptional ArsR family regulator
MSEPARRRIIEILSSGEHSSGEITDAVGRELGITRQAVSKHLRILRENGWVDVRPEWASRIYSLEEYGIEQLELEVDYLKYLWARRIGTRERNDPQLKHAFPFVPRKYPRERAGSVKGLRGTGCRDDPWAPQNQRQPESRDGQS